MKYLKKVIIALSVTFFVAAFSVVLVYSKKSTINDLANYSVALVSLIISIIALVFALLTYYSIDSVNSISSLEGNILENEHYSISNAGIFQKYMDITNQRELCDLLFDEQKVKLKNESKTNKEFSDCIQRMIDDYCIVGSLNYDDDNYQSKLSDIWNLVDRRYKQLKNISNGMQYVIDENIRFIKYLYKVDGFENAVKIESIAGDLFKNPYTRYLYIDSLGREHVEKVRQYLRKKINAEHNIWFLLDEFNKMKEAGLVGLDATACNNTETNWETVEVSVHLEGAIEAYKATLAEDLINQPFTPFVFQGILRVEILKSILFKRNDDAVKSAFENAMAQWNRFIVTNNIDISSINNSFLKTEYYTTYHLPYFYYYNYRRFWGENVDEFKPILAKVFEKIETNELCKSHTISSLSVFCEEWTGYKWFN